MKKNDKHSTKRKVLGRGLEALLSIRKPESIEQRPERKPIETTVPETEKIHKLLISKIVSNPYQPRIEFNQESLSELVESIKENGLLSPIICRKKNNDGFFEIISGERRLRACQIAGLREIDAIIKEVEDNKNMLQLALIENIQRADLNPLEEARAYKRLNEEFNMTQDDVAQKVGKKRATVANILRILALSQEIQDFIQNNQITLGHAKLLLSLPTDIQQRKVAKYIINKGLSVKETENVIKKLTNTVKSGEIEDHLIKNPNITAVEEDLKRKLGTLIQIKGNSNKGKIIINYYNEQDFDRIYNLLK